MSYKDFWLAVIGGLAFGLGLGIAHLIYRETGVEEK